MGIVDRDVVGGSLGKTPAVSGHPAVTIDSDINRPPYFTYDGVPMRVIEWQLEKSRISVFRVEGNATKSDLTRVRYGHLTYEQSQHLT